MKDLTLKIALAALLIYPTTSTAFTTQELQLMPNYCQDKLAVKNKSHWEGIFGEHWAHMHHYCYAIIWYSKALTAPFDATGQDGRGFFLAQTKSNLNYSIEAAKAKAATWRLLPNAYYKLAKALEAQKQNIDAMKNYQKAVNLNKKFALAYASISDLFKKLGDIKNAKQYIEEGLQYSPNSRALKRRKAKLDSRK